MHNNRTDWPPPEWSEGLQDTCRTLGCRNSPNTPTQTTSWVRGYRTLGEYLGVGCRQCNVCDSVLCIYFINKVKPLNLKQSIVKSDATMLNTPPPHSPGCQDSSNTPTPTTSWVRVGPLGIWHTGAQGSTGGNKPGSIHPDRHVVGACTAETALCTNAVQAHCGADKEEEEITCLQWLLWLLFYYSEKYDNVH